MLSVERSPAFRSVFNIQSPTFKVPRLRSYCGPGIRTSASPGDSG